MRIPVAYLKTFQGPATGIVVERERLDKFGRPLLGATVKPKLGLSGRNYGRVVYEALQGRAGLHQGRREHQFTAVHALARALPVLHGGREPRFGGHRRGQRPLPERDRRAPWRTCTSAPNSQRSWARSSSWSIWWPATPPSSRMAKWARRNDMILHLHRAGNSTYARQKNHGINFRVICKWMRMAGVDHLHAGTVVGKLEGDPLMVRGFYDTLREPHTPVRLENGLVLRAELGVPAHGDAGGIRRHPRGTDAPTAALPRART